MFSNRIDRVLKSYNMSKDNFVLDEAKLLGSSNFHLWKYIITRVAKREKLWYILSSSSSSSTSEKKPDEDSEVEKHERLMYIMSMSIKSSFLAQLTKF